MSSRTDSSCIAFDGDRRVASGDLRAVARAAKELLDRKTDASVLVFDVSTGGPIDIDFRGSLHDMLARLSRPETAAADEEAAPPARRGPGRPRLGVVAREVTLLPRHWDWLALQPGGASVAIRKLVEAARRSSGDKDRGRLAQEATYRFVSAIAGDKPHYEEAIRALFAADAARFDKLIAGWPADIRDHALVLAGRAFQRQA